MISPNHINMGMRQILKWAARAAVLLLFLSIGWTAPLLAQSSGTDTEQVDEGGKEKKKKDKKKKEKKEKPPKEKKKKKDKKGKKNEDQSSGSEELIGSDDGSRIGEDGLDSDLETIRDTSVSQLDTTDTHAAWLCARYRTGKMEFIDKNFQGIKVKRKRRSETWYNYNTGNKSTFRIIWEGNCYYKLRFKKSKKPNRFRKGDEMGFKIVACYEDYCDIDADLHAIMYYLSIRKGTTAKEKKLKAKQELQKLKEEEKAARIAEQKARFEEGKEGGEKGDGAKEAGEGGEKESKPDDGGDDNPDAKQADKKKTKEKKEKAPKEKKAKKDKEKKEKPQKEKKEKKPKEKKEKDKKKKDGDEEDES